MMLGRGSFLLFFSLKYTWKGGLCVLVGGSEIWIPRFKFVLVLGIWFYIFFSPTISGSVFSAASCYLPG